MRGEVCLDTPQSDACYYRIKAYHIMLFTRSFQKSDNSRNRMTIVFLRSRKLAQR